MTLEVVRNGVDPQRCEAGPLAYETRPDAKTARHVKRDLMTSFVRELSSQPKTRPQAPLVRRSFHSHLHHRASTVQFQQKIPEHTGQGARLREHRGNKTHHGGSSGDGRSGGSGMPHRNRDLLRSDENQKGVNQRDISQVANSFIETQRGPNTRSTPEHQARPHRPKPTGTTNAPSTLTALPPHHPTTLSTLCRWTGVRSLIRSPWYV